jgi:hypothetical protein
MKFHCGYGWHIYMNNAIAYCKKLHQEGYTNTQIQLITKLSTSSISRIVNGHTHSNVDSSDFSRSPIFEDRLHVLNTLLECQEISGGMGLDENNKIYIQILKRVGTDFAKVQELYYDISKKALRNAWMYPVGKIKNFDGAALNVTVEEILDLLKTQEAE